MASDKLLLTVEADKQDALLDLPWDLPLEEWPDELLVPLPRGISRHVVRFVDVGDQVLAFKEVTEEFAHREYRLLRDLEELEIPSVRGVGVVAGRTDRHGEPLPGVLMTEHLTWSMPYRAVFSHGLRPDTVDRLLDALVVLLVRLHLVGFAWGDCSLSNVLFRRDAGAFAAYLVDAETGEMHPELSRGQREFDVDVAHINMVGGLMDLIAGDQIEIDLDPLAVADEVPRRYRALWDELTGVEHIDSDERWRIAQRVDRLNRLGFDVAELDLRRDKVGGLRIQPRVVDPGFHSRRLMRLTGLDVGENQARRLLNDLDQFAAARDAAFPGALTRSAAARSRREAVAAHAWLSDVYEPVVLSVPEELRGKLEDAELFHEVLEHRWFMSERAGRDLPMDEVVADYIWNVLGNKPDEELILPEPDAGPPTEELFAIAPDTPDDWLPG